MIPKKSGFTDFRNLGAVFYDIPRVTCGRFRRRLLYHKPELSDFILYMGCVAGEQGSAFSRTVSAWGMLFFYYHVMLKKRVCSRTNPLSYLPPAGLEPAWINRAILSRVRLPIPPRRLRLL